MKERKLVLILLIIQTIIFIIVGTKKEYIHMDEAYSYGLASYKQTEIQNNDDFYNTWHTNDYYEDYLVLNESELSNLKPVYENQKNDVHPPLFYLLLRFTMIFTKEHFSIWSGIILNIIIYLFITIFIYFILKELLKKDKYSNEKSIIFAFLSSITLSSLSNVIFIRMYTLSTLTITITTYLHLKLLQNSSLKKSLFIQIGLSTICGILTHYYYLFFLFALYLLCAIILFQENKKKTLWLYTITIIISGLIAIIIFPYALKHMFSGYRGQGVINNLTNPSNFLIQILGFFELLNRYGFHLLLPCILIIILIAHKKTNNKLLKIIYIPSMFYFLIVSIASPYISLRYIMPVTQLLFISTIYMLDKSIKQTSLQNLIYIMIFLSPIMFHLEPVGLYRDYQEIVEKVKNEYNLPTIYFFNSKNNRFLDDILLFSFLKESYIAKDINPTLENIQNIIKEKDTRDGLLIFINDEQNHQEIIQNTKENLKYTNIEHVKRLNSCDIYLLKE